MRIKTNCRVQLPGGEMVLADRQPASTERLERAGLIGTANAHLFFLQGAFELPLNGTLVLTAKSSGYKLVSLLPTERRSFEIRDVDTWDTHTEVLVVEQTATGQETENWTRRRFVGNGTYKPSGAENGSYQTIVVALSFDDQSGDDAGDMSRVTAEVVGARGTLQTGDILRHSTRGVYEVRDVAPKGDWERAVIFK